MLRSRLLLVAAYRDLPLAGDVLRRRGAVRGVPAWSAAATGAAASMPEHALALRGTITNGDSVDSPPVCR